MADDQRIPTLREVLADAIERLDRLSWHQGSGVVDTTLRYVIGRLKEALARPGPEPVPAAASWRYYALIDPEGRPLWRGWPPGGAVEGLDEALLWPTIDAWLGWIDGQNEATQLRIHGGGWRLAEVHATARLIGPPTGASAGREAP